MTDEFIRKALSDVLAFIGLTDSTGQPLVLAPHDFRPPVVDAIRSGLPPHIAQVILGHANINTTMGCNANHPTETSRLIAPSSPASGPCDLQRSSAPSGAEWEDFLGHFERRKHRRHLRPCLRNRLRSRTRLLLRCSMLRPDPAQRHRLVEIPISSPGSRKPNAKAGSARSKD